MITKPSDLSKDVAELLHGVALDVSHGRNVPLLRMLEMKSKLKANVGLDDAFTLYAKHIAPGSQVRVRQQKVLYQKDLAEDRAREMHIVEPGGNAVVMQPCRTVGAPPLTSDIKGTTRQVFVACFDNATAYARSSAIRLDDGKYAFDLQDGELGSMPVDMAFDPVVFHQNGRFLRVIDDRRPNTCLRVTKALSLLGSDTMSFGHWMGEEMLKFLTARLVDETRDLPILIDAGIPKQHKQSIVAFVGPDHPIIEVPRFCRVEADKLWIVSNWFYSPKMLTTDVGVSPDGLAYASGPMAELMMNAWDELSRKHNVPGGEAQFFVARDNDRHRSVTNAGAVLECLERHGYAPLRPEGYSFLEQFATYRKSQRLVFQSGSAMMGAFMCRPGTQVCLLSHPAMPFIAIWTDVLRAAGIDVVAVVGPFDQRNEIYGDKSSYALDPAVLDATLTAMKGTNS